MRGLGLLAFIHIQEQHEHNLFSSLNVMGNLCYFKKQLHDELFFIVKVKDLRWS